MTAIWSLIAFLVAIGLLVSFHELGHYTAARVCGVRVLRFSVGFGKTLWTYQKSSDSTEWALSSLPLGGYVKMDENSFQSKPLWKRSFIVVAGPLANFVLAIIFLATLFVSGVPQIPSKLAEPAQASLAYEAGVFGGDTVTGWKQGDDASFKPIVSWNQLRWRLLDAVTAKEGFVLQVTTAKGDQQAIVFKEEKMPKLAPDVDPLATLGIKPDLNEPVAVFELKLGLFESLRVAVERVWDVSVVSLRMLGGIFTGESSIKQIGGPLSIADMAGKSVHVGWQSYLGFLALISISLGILNLMPLPMLDGGQLLYDAWELLTGSKVPEAWQNVLQRVGVGSLMLLTILALFNDISRLFLR
ncbi:MAG: M50 family metallopeptidase [Polynucleobacter victoriensis]